MTQRSVIRDAGAQLAQMLDAVDRGELTATPAERQRLAALAGILSDAAELPGRSVDLSDVADYLGRLRAAIDDSTMTATSQTTRQLDRLIAVLRP